MVRKCRGGGMGEGIDRNYLRKAMNSCRKDLVTAEDIVDDLRSRDGVLARMIPQRLLRSVRKLLNERNIKRVRDEERYDDNGNEEGSAAQRKKQRRVDEIEEQEQSGLTKKNMERSPSSSLSNSEKLSPRFDLIKDGLRDNYATSNNSSPIGSFAEKNVEVETVSNRGGSNLATMWARKEAKASISLGPRFKDFGGIEKILYRLNMNILFPLMNPEPFEELGVKPVSGILFHGPPGCGKTKLANAIANEAGVPFYKISATDVISGVSGASEENIRELFAEAYRTAPSIVFIDEIDAIGSKRENQQREMEKRIVTQLMTCMDGPGHKDDKSGPNSNAGYVLVIGATNRPDALDPALRRRGRFECEIALSAPDEDARADILSVIAQKLKVEGPFDAKRIARLTPGFVGADLESVVFFAGRISLERNFHSRISKASAENEYDNSWLRLPWPKEELNKLFVTMSDFEEAVNLVQPSLTREGFSIMPDIKRDDVGGLGYVQREMNSRIVRPIKKSYIYKALQLDQETGVLLYGPPGCGKTLIAKATANEAGANFMHIKGPELLNKYVGESEKAIRTLFQRAQTCAPCVMFFDEVDALTTSRGNEGAWAVEGLLKSFLVELDGAERHNVYVIGATNMPEVINPAFLRPGRFGNLVYVTLPNADERVSILKAIAKKKPIDPSVDLDSIARFNCEGFSGADLAHLVHTALLQVADELDQMGLSEDDLKDTNNHTAKMTHFERALSLVSPSVNKQQIKIQQTVTIFRWEDSRLKLWTENQQGRQWSRFNSTTSRQIPSLRHPDHIRILHLQCLTFLPSVSNSIVKTKSFSIVYLTFKLKLRVSLFH